MESQMRTFAGLALVLLVFVALLTNGNAEQFVRFFGSFHPIPVSSLAWLIGGTSMWYLGSSHGFSVFDKAGSRKGIGFAALTALFFGGAIVTIDIAAPFPEDINVHFPISVLFYPAMALVVESVFHLAPLAIFLFVGQTLGSAVSGQKMKTVALALTAMLEPLFQFLLMVIGSGISVFAVVILTHIAAINYTQLYIFRRFDFVSMFAFRIFYYLIWHVAWGWLRLQ